MSIFSPSWRPKRLERLRVLERVPEGKDDWKPHPKSMALGRLAMLVAQMPSWISLIVGRAGDRDRAVAFGDRDACRRIADLLGQQLHALAGARSSSPIIFWSIDVFMDACCPAWLNGRHGDPRFSPCCTLAEAGGLAEWSMAVVLKSSVLSRIQSAVNDAVSTDSTRNIRQSRAAGCETRPGWRAKPLM